MPWFWVFAAVFIPLHLWVLSGLIGYWPSRIIAALVVIQGSSLWAKWWRKRKAAPVLNVYAAYRCLLRFARQL